MKIMITGANQRIGLFLAARWLQHGHDVVAVIRQPSEALQLLKTQHANRLQYHLTDLRTQAWNAAFWESYADTDHLIHCASTFVPDQAGTSTEDYREECRILHYDTLINSAISWFQAGGMGSIVHFLDQKVQRLNPDHLSYTLSKVAAASVIPVLAQSLAPRIRINAIAPGLTLPSGDQHQLAFEQAVSTFPLGMGATLASLGDGVDFFLQHPNVTGQTITIDGGQHLMSDRDILFHHKE